MSVSDIGRPVSPGAPLAVADHDLVARIARVWVLQHRPIKSQRELARLVDELETWHNRTREQLVRRFGDHEVADWFDHGVGPLVRPNERAPLAEQIAVVRAQADLRLRWLAELRAELPQRLPVGAAVPNARGHVAAAAATDVIVLRPPGQSPTSTAVIAALEALGEGQPTVVELSDDIGAVEEAVPAGAAAVVIIEREHRSHHPSAVALLALGWATGALGRDRVLAVLAPLVDDQPALDTFTMVPAKVRARWRAEVVAWAAAASRLPD
jgi:hypothetical protein